MWHTQPNEKLYSAPTVPYYNERGTFVLIGRLSLSQLISYRLHGHDFLIRNLIIECENLNSIIYLLSYRLNGRDFLNRQQTFTIFFHGAHLDPILIE